MHLVLIVQLCNMLYFNLADFVALRSCGGNTNLRDGSRCSNSILMVIMLPSVSDGSRVGRKGVLFFLIMEKTLSSAAFEWGIVRTNLATHDNLWNLSWPSRRLMLPSWFHTASAFCSSLQPWFNSDSSSGRVKGQQWRESANKTYKIERWIELNFTVRPGKPWASCKIEWTTESAKSSWNQFWVIKYFFKKLRQAFGIHLEEMFRYQCGLIPLRQILGVHGFSGHTVNDWFHRRITNM